MIDSSVSTASAPHNTFVQKRYSCSAEISQALVENVGRLLPEAHIVLNAGTADHVLGVLTAHERSAERGGGLIHPEDRCRGVVHEVLMQQALCQIFDTMRGETSWILVHGNVGETCLSDTEYRTCADGYGYNMRIVDANGDPKAEIDAMAIHPEHGVIAFDGVGSSGGLEMKLHSDSRYPLHDRLGDLLETPVHTCFVCMGNNREKVRKIMHDYAHAFRLSVLHYPTDEQVVSFMVNILCKCLDAELNMGQRRKLLHAMFKKGNGKHSAVC